MVLWRSNLEALYWAGISAVRPDKSVGRALRFSEGRLYWEDNSGNARFVELPVLLLGAGKASVEMAQAVAHILPPGTYHGAVVSPSGAEVTIPGIDVLVGSHPVPDHRSLAAAEHVLALCRSRSTEPVVFLLSGGASSLLSAPWPPVTLEDKATTNQLLLNSGASIEEVNTVRKHISRIKGGRLLRELQRDVFTLAISDVVGDDPAVIGSGPTVPDPTTFADAKAVLWKHSLWETVPASVRTVIEEGLAGRIPETVKPDEPIAQYAHYRIVARNRDALGAIALAAGSMHWGIELLDKPTVGEARQAAHHFAQQIQRLLACGGHTPRCLIAGGETTVTVTGGGSGGRNQEFALALAPLIAGQPVSVLSAGTDGVDGPTDAAGAFVDGTTVERALRLGLDPEDYLKNNDSYHFFSALGDLFFPGPTGTNVMDVQIAVISP